jgi:uncharacterized protein involved in type VI secretion and phage assembly
MNQPDLSHERLTVGDGPFHGIYRGLVLVRIDPDKQGRIKIKMPHVYGDISEESLPWAYPMCPAWADSSGQFQGGGMGWVPPINSPVYVFFEGGNPLYPIWTAGWWGGQNAPFQMPVHAHDDAGNPDNLFFTAPNGATVQIDFRAGKEKILLRLPKGDHIKIGMDGELDIHSEQNVNMNAPVKIQVQSDGTVNIKGKDVKVYSSGDTVVNSSGSTDIRAQSVNIDASRVSINGGRAKTLTGDDAKIDTEPKEDGT